MTDDSKGKKIEKEFKEEGANEAPIVSITPSPTSSSSSTIVPKVAPKPREKVVLAPGHSPLDWAKLCSSAADLRGTKGQIYAHVPMSEVAKHNKKEDAWIVIRGNVYNITPYLPFHPGGIPQIMRGAGKDGTALFDEKHSWVNVEALLSKCFIGRCDFTM